MSDESQKERIGDKFNEYRVYEKLNYKLYKEVEDWTALEELLLLEGLI